MPNDIVSNAIDELARPAAASWRSKMPPALARELAALREQYDATLRKALGQSEIEQRFLRDPVGVLDEAKIPLSAAMRAALRGPSGVAELATPRRLFVPGAQILTPQVAVRIRDGEAAPHVPLAHAGVRDLIPEPFAHYFKRTGDQTHGFPVVYEITRKCVEDIGAQWFDSGPLHDLMNALIAKIPDAALRGLAAVAKLAQAAFDLDVSIGMPAGQTSTLPDLLTIALAIPHADPSAPPSTDVQVSARLAITASVVVDHSDPQREQIYLDVAHALAACTATIRFANVPLVGTRELDLSSEFAGLLGALALDGVHPGRIPVFFDVPVDRSGATAYKPTRYDLRLLDDPTNPDCDALALLMSFAGAEAGDRSAFTASFLTSGSGIVVDFNWLRSKILPKLKEALSLPTDIDAESGWWFGEAPIAGDDAVLTALGLGVLPGTHTITIVLSVRKSGDCYTATGSLSATMSVGVVDGVFTFAAPQLGAPLVSVDIPWYCYLASILVGGALGGILAGSLGSLVGMVLVPVLLHSVQNIAQSVLQAVVDKVDAPIASATAGIQQIDLGQLKTVLQYAAIDDLVMLHRVTALDHLPALIERSVFVPNGGYLDLSNGEVAPMQGTVGDLGVAGTGASRVLMTLGRAALAPIGVVDPEAVTRVELYRASYATTQRVPLDQLAPGTPPVPTGMVWAVRDDAGHYSRFTVTGAPADGLWIHFKTYPLELGENIVTPALQLTGAFAAFHRPPSIGAAPTAPTAPALHVQVGTGGAAWAIWGSPDSWYDVGTFTAKATGFASPVSCQWSVAQQPLTATTGTLTVAGAPVSYQLAGASLTLTVDPLVLMTMTIGVAVSDANGRQAFASISAATVGGGHLGDVITPQVPELGDYLRAYKKHIGPWVELDPETVADRGYRVITERRG
jgi:hypothetical protein